MSLAGFSLAYFRWIGAPLLKLFKGIPKSLDAAGRRIYPETYTSVIGFFFFIAFIIALPIALILFPFLGLISLAVLAAPMLVVVAGVMYPASAAATRASNLETEVPFASAYISVMATGGISPYKSMERLKTVKLLPNLSEAARIMDIDVKAVGMDPVSAMEKSAKALPSKEYKDLLLGYASTLRIGGDVVHYLHRRTQMIFEERSAKFKIIGERVAMLMEGYAAVATLLALGMYVMFIISKVLPAEVGMFTPSSFVLFAYIILPVISMIFLYLTDMFQPRYPSSDWRIYKAFALSLPVMIFCFTVFVIPYYIFPLKPFFSPFLAVPDTIRKMLNLELGFESSIGLSLAVMIGFIPGMFAHHRYSSEASEVARGITNFLRDLVEVRKTGMSPEKCIQNLAKAGDYGRFTRHLKVMARQIGWGLPLGKIYKTFQEKVHGWLAQITMYLLIDAIDVGGGTPEILETLTSFGENIEALEKQKKMTLRPLILIPYIGAVVLVASTVVLIGFLRSILSIASMSIAYGEFVMLFVPPLVLNGAINGLVAGKVAEERVSAGFKHAFILTLVTLVSIALSPSVAMSLKLGTSGGMQ